MLADRLVERVPLRLARRDWLLIITYGVLLDCEEQTGEDMLGQTAAFTAPTARIMQGLLWGALRRQDPSLTIRDVGAFITPRVAPAILAALQKAFVASMPEPEKRKTKDGGKIRKPMSWLQTRAVARIELGLSDKEFLNETPRSFRALRIAYVEHQRWVELVAGGIRESVVNFSGRAKQAVSASKYVIHSKPDDDEPEKDIGEVIYEQMMKGQQRA